MASQWRVEIEFCHHSAQGESLCLRWDVLDHPPSALWLKCFSHFLREDYDYYGRFTGFTHGHRDLDYLCRGLNQAIDIINSEGHYHIPERADGVFTQKFSNIMHHHFEVLFGSIEKRSEIFNKSSAYAQYAIERLNHYIHDMETFEREREREKHTPENSFSALISEIRDLPRYRFPDEFFNYFVTDIEFGDMVAHYSLVGKTWWEVFLDGDEEIFPEAIRPLNVMTGDFDVFFGQYSMPDSHKKEFFEFLKKQGKDPNDPALGLGYLPLAKFRRDLDLTNTEYKKLLANYMRVQKIRLCRGDEVVAQKDLSESVTSTGGFSYRFPPQFVGSEKVWPVERAPVQLLPIQSQHPGGVTLPFKFKSEHYLKTHTLCFLGASDEYPVTIENNPVEYGVELFQDSLTLKRGDLIDLLFHPKRKIYYLIKKNRSRLV